ncbi:hypothetical protein S7711_01433 [Stachybotrys chartarum IBT 7711]|uniref:Heme oxygenase n=1 Tax=Stachybotrys chartarum (strain CBS 109288 / IBT 7711) TaxID=1280523 RepID=A0A084B6Y7_STACB|nr:hypothetical protein S7711_01433 [Stachybotrys chartarum IBT 7711]
MASSVLENPHDDRPLAHAIAAATRSVHAELNKLIIARLPLALPPRAIDPAFYVSGLLHVANVYITFESLWREILDNPPAQGSDDDDDDNDDNDDAQLGADEPSPPATGDVNSSASNGNQTQPSRPPQASERIHTLLQHLYLPDIMRSCSLKDDIRQLTGWSREVVDEQLRTVAETGRLGEFVSHIDRAVRHKPHILVAYSYIMFMALFAGGRLIRAFLESVGDEFWNTLPSPVKPTLQQCRKDTAGGERIAGEYDVTCELGDGVDAQSNHATYFRFFHFSTAMDGEDLKFEFKSRLSDLEKSLTPREKRDITQEAVCIFDNMRLLVRQLDMVCTGLDQEDIDEEVKLDSLGNLLRSTRGRYRDSVAVTKARAARGSSRISSSEDGSDSRFATPTPTSDRLPDVESAPAEKTDRSTPRHPFLQAHTPFPGLANAHLCPAMSKSMRFETALPHPARQCSDENGDIGAGKGGLTLFPKRIFGLHVTNLVVAAAFGLVIVCSLLSGKVTAPA